MLLNFTFTQDEVLENKNCTWETAAHYDCLEVCVLAQESRLPRELKEKIYHNAPALSFIYRKKVNIWENVVVSYNRSTFLEVSASLLFSKEILG